MTNKNSKTANLAQKPVVLCILDGWGDRGPADDNAIHLAKTPTWDRLVRSVPRGRLDASAEQVGLPTGQMGNSEVGHMNLGAGRIVMQDLPRIDAAIADGTLASDTKLAAFMDGLKAAGGTCHLMGLMSPGGVHSHQDHMVALARILAKADIPVVIHAFMDGRDTPPRAGRDALAAFLNDLEGLDNVTVGTVIGRYWAMDRDNRWERVVKAYDAMVTASGVETAESALAAMAASYEADIGDEFVEPCIIGDYAGMQDGDGLLCANFRADRAREILSALADPEFEGFVRGCRIDFSARLGMIEYSTDLNRFFPALFPPENLTGILGEVVSNAGLKQLRIAETEKYAHVTFFLNGGREAVFAGEERILVPSPKVATYDLQPEMSAGEVTDHLVNAIDEAAFDLIVVNYANGDMVGHTGVLPAAIKAAETLDACLARLEKAVTEAGGRMIVTADHGNCEQMSDAGGPHTAHTLNMVPVLLVNPPAGVSSLESGRLADIAPTLLDLLGLEQPQEMTGRSLLDPPGERRAAE